MFGPYEVKKHSRQEIHGKGLEIRIYELNQGRIVSGIGDPRRRVVSRFTDVFGAFLERI